MMNCSKAEAKAKMPAAEVHDWVEFWQREPPGAQYANQQFAAFAAICCSLLRNISNTMAGTKIKTKFTADDFMGTKKYSRVPSSQELTTKLHIWANRANSARTKRRKGAA
jgi:hypothetical protein